MFSLIRSFMCSKGGIAWTFLLPLMHLLNPVMFPMFFCAQLIFWVCIFTPIFATKPHALNSSKGKKDAGRAIGFTFLFYYLFVLALMFLSRMLLCSEEVAQQVQSAQTLMQASGMVL